MQKQKQSDYTKAKQINNAYMYKENKSLKTKLINVCSSKQRLRGLMSIRKAMTIFNK